MHSIEDDPTVSFHVAEATLEVFEKTFYSSWTFLWKGELVRASVNNELEDINILTDHAPEEVLHILEFIKTALAKIKKGEPVEEENWD